MGSTQVLPEKRNFMCADGCQLWETQSGQCLTAMVAAYRSLALYITPPPTSRGRKQGRILSAVAKIIKTGHWINFCFDFNPLVLGDFLFSLLMKVHTEVHYGNRLGNPKFQVSTFIHYQDMKKIYFSVFLTVQLYFPTNCIQILT